VKRKASFVDLRDTLFGKASGMIHQVELMVDREVKEAFLGYPIESITEEWQFWSRAGYEYIPIVTSAFGFMGEGSDNEITQEKVFKYSKYSADPQKKRWAKEGKGVVTNLIEFRDLAWPDPEKIDLSVYQQARKQMPKEMGIVGVVPRIFVAVWMLMGYEQFSLSLADQPGLVEALFNKVGEIQLRICCKLLKEAEVDALWLGDDIAHGHGLMASPFILRSFLFPWYREIGNICRKARIPLIYHSDGNVYQVIHDLIDCGINALHPVEPSAMDAVQLKQEFGKNLCLLGNIELDTLARGNIKEVEKLTLSRLERLWTYGGYCPGSSNSITNYVPLENFRAMLQSIRQFEKKIRKYADDGIGS
jgi:uroporphyrinogen decarboxylase